MPMNTGRRPEIQPFANPLNCPAESQSIQFQVLSFRFQVVGTQTVNLTKELFFAPYFH